MDVAVAYESGSRLLVAPLSDGLPVQPRQLSVDQLDRLPSLIDAPADRIRWVWADTAAIYPRLLDRGVRVERCQDLRLCHAILAGHEPSLAADDRWRRQGSVDAEPTLLDDQLSDDRVDLDEVIAEHRRQQDHLAPAPDLDDQERIRRAKLRLLLSAESAGALIAAEMAHSGLPWDVAVHDRLLTEMLGPRPRYGERPAKLQAVVDALIGALEVGPFNPDSPVTLIDALHRAGIQVNSTRKWELEKIDHPAIEPLLEYKKLSRLLSANGWSWMDTWITGGRFRPDYVVGGVVTGRWATDGGGALQLPKQIRSASRADPGWKLVVADASQLEPRVLAAMARDDRMAAAAHGHDLYQGLVDTGVVDTRAHAKVAMLGALYGATTGYGGNLMPRLIQAYPRATGVVEQAARAGERGEIVSTFLGRRSPRPPESWREQQRLAAGGDAPAEEVRRARQQARDWGRFTRNFVVQGTAAEWALCWMAGLRQRLVDLGTPGARPHLVYFLHDEVIVHSPADCADVAAELIKDAAAAAGRLLFGESGVEFALEVAIVDNYGQAK
ncbi:bifunctional 3'-5' exonuclease/DNA polymerase [Microlunatus sp. Gsoil 973]|uniref:bifunctional 3'-5' exonuclease/DNA polymerase n=1 Tax=Microlunatus sp. Gsoil 973 TaxID=2672569 RepID=UPI0012B4AAB0|nr:bifunctional 3'-5' exonuclease/DNA polymerase [Microlunatus sp. Gsoil 973]QGN34734.1 bifunctional 3'-5' exonuclease/DNA polymerase [Microlunatus sp. Gsoil 973]